MTGLSQTLKDNLTEYVRIDPYTMPDPFDENIDYAYSVITDRLQPSRTISIIATKKDLSLKEKEVVIEEEK